MTEEIESGRSVTEEQREDPTQAPGAVVEGDRSAGQRPRGDDQRPAGSSEGDTVHEIAVTDPGPHTDK